MANITMTSHRLLDLVISKKWSFVLLMLAAVGCQAFNTIPLSTTTSTTRSFQPMNKRRNNFIGIAPRGYHCSYSKSVFFSLHYFYRSCWSSSPSLSHTSVLRGQNRYDNDNGDDSLDFDSYEQAWLHNQRRTDVRIFLTQRALQSFIYVLLSFRDPHTVKWLEKTYDFANLESYHGTGALNLTRFDTWDSLFLDLVNQPNSVVIVAARRRGRGHAGWSEDNPHMDHRFVEFEIDIEPASLVSRLVSVRQQIAQEWVDDLDTIVAVNELILESYHETQDQQRRAEEEGLESTAGEPRSDDDHHERDQQDGNTNSPGDDCMSIEDLTVPYSDNESSSNFHHPFQRPRRRQAYESMAAVYLNNKMMEHEARTGRPSSPQRKGSFDLLGLLATQEAVHMVLRDYLEQGETRRVSLEWLLQFYDDRIDSHFDGDGPYGRSDDFMQDLLLSPPSATTSVDGNVMELVDPLRIAEEIIQARSIVARKWKEIMQTVVPSDHMQLQKAILAVRMMGQQHTQQPQVPDMSSEPAATTSTASASTREVFGEFE